MRAGIYRQSSSVLTETVHTLEEIFIHPEYNHSKVLHDIALARVKAPFSLDTFSATVCLPTIDVDTIDIEVPKKGDECYAAGWGVSDDDFSTISDVLQEVRVPINEECPKNNGIYICGGFEEGGKDTCQGRVTRCSAYFRAKFWLFLGSNGYIM